MGATGWDYFVPYQADVSAALQQLREDVFAKGEYECGVRVSKEDFEKALSYLGSNLKAKMDLFAARASDQRLPPQTRDKFRKLEEQLKQTASPGGSTPANVSKPRTIEALLKQQGESGTHSILDIDRISETPEFGAITALRTQSLLDIFGSGKPTRQQIETSYEEGVLEEFVSERWQGIYIVAFQDASPAEIFFAGCSGD